MLFRSKYLPDGTRAWTRLLGASGYDSVFALATGPDGTIYVGGETTGSLDGQANGGQWDGFIASYRPDGTRLWTRLLGGSGSDRASALVVGVDGTIYVGGFAETALDGESPSGGYDAFVTSYRADGSKVWTRMLGSSGFDMATDLDRKSTRLNSSH